jgi:hypothetical protein
LRSGLGAQSSPAGSSAEGGPSSSLRPILEDLLVSGPLREENQLRVECVASADGPTVLTLAVNGQALVRAEDETGGREFDGVGLFVDTTGGGAEALFDDLAVTELVLR